jgi:hypothetical protein
VQFGEHHLNARKSGFWFNVYWNAASVIFNRDTAVFVELYGDFLAVSGQSLVHAVIDNFPKAVHQAAAVSRAYVHARALSNRLQAL